MTKWLDPRVLDYHGQQTPPQWHAALVAVLRLRPHLLKTNAATLYDRGATEALQAVHEAVARELDIRL